MFKLPRLLIILLLAFAPTLRAENLYSATTPRTHPTKTLSYFYNPGPDNGGEAGHIVFDDVTISSSLALPVFNVKQITIKVTQKANAPAFTVTPYFGQLFPDSIAYGGPGDQPFYDVLSPTQFSAPRQVPGNSLSETVEKIITFGDRVHTLFNVKSAITSPSFQQKSFAVGMLLSTVDSLSGWTLAQNPDNQDVLWDYKSDSNFSEFTYPFSDGNGMVVGTQYLTVQGLALSGIQADANGDSLVNIADLRALAAHFGQAGDYTMGDFNFDTVVDRADLSILAQNWGSDPLMPLQLTALGLPTDVVPEPGGLALVCTSICLLIRGRRRV